MHSTESSESAAERQAGVRHRQVLFYAADGLLGGTFTCSRCGAGGRQPDVIDHSPGCSYGPPAVAETPG